MPQRPSYSSPGRNTGLETLAQLMQLAQGTMQQQQQQEQQRQLMLYNLMSLDQQRQQHEEENAYRRDSLAQQGVYQQGELAARNRALEQAGQQFQTTNELNRDQLRELQSFHDQAGQQFRATNALEQERLRELQVQHDTAQQMQNKALFMQKQERDQARIQDAFDARRKERLSVQALQQREAGDLLRQLAAQGQLNHPLAKAALNTALPETAQNAIQIGQLDRLNTLKTQVGTMIGAMHDKPALLQQALAPLKAQFGDVWEHPEVQTLLKSVPQANITKPSPGYEDYLSPERLAALSVARQQQAETDRAKQAEVLRQQNASRSAKAEKKANREIFDVRYPYMRDDLSRALTQGRANELLSKIDLNDPVNLQQVIYWGKGNSSFDHVLPQLEKKLKEQQFGVEIAKEFLPFNWNR